MADTYFENKEEPLHKVAYLCFWVLDRRDEDLVDEILVDDFFSSTSYFTVCQRFWKNCS